MKAKTRIKKQIWNMQTSILQKNFNYYYNNLL